MSHISIDLFTVMIRDFLLREERKNNIKKYIYIKRQEKGEKEKDNNNNKKEDREHLLDSTDLLKLHVHDCP